MNVLEELNKLLSIDIDLYNDKIYEIDKKIDRIKESDRIKKVVNNNDQLYLSQVKEIGYYYPELMDYVFLLQEIEAIYKSIRSNHYQEVLPDRIRVVLSKSDISSDEVIKVIDDFFLCEKLNKDIKYRDNNSQNIGEFKHAHNNILAFLVKAFNNIFDKLVSETKMRSSNKDGIDILMIQKEKMLMELNNLKKFQRLFVENNFEDELSTEDIELFSQWIESKHLFNKKQEIIQKIINRQRRNKTEEEIIDENHNKIIEKMQEEILSRGNSLDDNSLITEEKTKKITK